MMQTALSERRSSDAVNAPSLGVQLTRLSMGCVLGIVFLAAAVSKATDPVRFGLVVSHLIPDAIVSANTIRAAVLSIVALEASVGLWLIMSGGSRRSAGAAAALLVVFTPALLVLSRLSSTGCGCFGSMFGSSNEIPWGLARNAVLLLMCGWILICGHEDKKRRVPYTRDGGFTIIEVIAVIAITALVIALLLPYLAGARMEARALRKTSDLHQIAMATTMYTQDQNDVFPFLGTPGDPTEMVRVDGVPVRRSFFRANALYWANLIWPDYIEQRAMLERPELDRESGNLTFASIPQDIIVTEIMLTHAAVADPLYWHDEEGQPTDLSFRFYRGQRLGSVRHPSRKGLLMVGEGLYFADRAGNARFAAADGSAHRQRFESIVHPEYLVERPFGAFKINMMSTLDGFEGVDY